MIPPPPISTLFPYTTLFRSLGLITGGAVIFWFTGASMQAVSTGAYRAVGARGDGLHGDRKSTRLNSSHQIISYAVFCLKKKKKKSSIVITTNRKIYNRNNIA